MIGYATTARTVLVAVIASYALAHAASMSTARTRSRSVPAMRCKRTL